jgi:hypothetical protein
MVRGSSLSVCVPQRNPEGPIRSDGHVTSVNIRSIVPFPYSILSSLNLGMASAPGNISVGTIVDISLGRGVVRFFGPTSFSAGKWVGIELFQPVGKNDGSVKGVPYFTCQPNYGVFVKPSQVKIIQDLPSSGTVSTALYFSPSSIMLTSHSQIPNLWLGHPWAIQERPALALRAHHPIVLFHLLLRVQRAPPRLGLVRVHVVARDLPLLLLLSEVQFRPLLSKVL